MLLEKLLRWWILDLYQFGRQFYCPEWLSTEQRGLSPSLHIYTYAHQGPFINCTYSRCRAGMVVLQPKIYLPFTYMKYYLHVISIHCAPILSVLSRPVWLSCNLSALTESSQSRPLCLVNNWCIIKFWQTLTHKVGHTCTQQAYCSLCCGCVGSPTCLLFIVNKEKCVMFPISHCWPLLLKLNNKLNIQCFCKF